MFNVEENIIMYAFRYALGRQTYAPYEVALLIKQNKDKFQSYTKQRIISEIDAQLNNWDYMHIDHPEDLVNLWTDVKTVLEKDIQNG